LFDGEGRYGRLEKRREIRGMMTYRQRRRERRSLGRDELRDGIENETQGRKLTDTYPWGWHHYDVGLPVSRDSDVVVRIAVRVGVGRGRGRLEGEVDHLGRRPYATWR
jgi:hypothetical protein